MVAARSNFEHSLVNLVVEQTWDTKIDGSFRYRLLSCEFDSTVIGNSPLVGLVINADSIEGNVLSS
jgi:hypothetical protein